MPQTFRKLAALMLIAPLLGAPLACSSSGDGDKAADTAKGTTKGSGNDASGRKTGGGAGSGSARITVGDSTWDFANAQCAFGEEAIGVPGAVANGAASQNGLSLYVSDDGDGRTYIELADLKDLDNGINWTTEHGGDGPTIKVDGKRITSEAEFVSMSAEGELRAPTPGSVEFNCG